MLFQLHPDFAQYSTVDWEVYATHLTNLLEAYRHGRHLVFARRETLEVLSRCDFLGDVCRNTIKELAERFNELSALSKELKRFAVIYDPNRGHRLEGIGGQVAIDIRQLVVPELLSGFRLFLENSVTDGFFWRAAFEVVASAPERRLPLLNLDIVHCGGHTMAGVLEPHVMRGEPVYCIVDSDRRSKFCQIGQTARAVQEMLVERGIMEMSKCGLSSTTPHAGFTILNVREVENLIPLEVISEILHSLGSDKYEYVRRLVPSQPRLNADRDKEIWQYYDIKADHDTEAMDYVSDEERSFFAVMIDRVGPELPRIRDGLLQDLSSYLSRNGGVRKKKFARELSESPFYEMIEEIFEDVYSLACAPQSRYY